MPYVAFMGGVTEESVTWDSVNQTGTWTLTNSDLTAEAAPASGFIWSILSTVGRSSGKRYCEVVFVSGSSFGSLVRHDIGAGTDHPPAGGSSISNTGAGYRRSGDIFSFGSNVHSGITALSANDVVGIAFDIDAGDIWFARNGTWTQGDPGAGTSPEVGTLAAGTYYIGASAESAVSMKVTLRAKNSQFSYSVPSGFVSWATS